MQNNKGIVTREIVVGCAADGTAVLRTGFARSCGTIGSSRCCSECCKSYRAAWCVAVDEQHFQQSTHPLLLE